MALIDSFFDTDSSGEFNLNDLSLSLRNAPPDFEAIGGLGSEPERLTAWLAATAYFHEVRHYHDLVGTPAGLGLFLESTRLVDEVLSALRDNDETNLVPLVRRASGAPPARAYRRHRSLLTAILGEAPKATAAHPADSDYRFQHFDFQDIGLTFWLPLVPIPRLDLRTGEFVERDVPIGLRAIMEHTATEIQLFLAAVGAGADRLATDDMAPRGQRFLTMLQELVRGERTPYFVLRTLAHYISFVRDRPAEGIAANFHLATLPPLGALMATAQAALDIGGYALTADEGWVFEHPGTAFIQLSTRFRDEGSFEANIDAADAAVADLIGRSWREFLSLYVRRLEASADHVLPEHLLPESASLPLIGDIRRIVLQDHLAIMRNKAENLEQWVNPVAYINALGTLPSPPLCLSADGRIAKVRSSQVGSYFVAWCILLGIIEGVMETGLVTCAVSSRLRGAMELIEFPDPARPEQSTGCHRFVEQGLCGRYDGRFVSGQPPQCPFARLIGNLHEKCGIKFSF